MNPVSAHFKNESARMIQVARNPQSTEIELTVVIKMPEDFRLRLLSCHQNRGFTEGGDSDRDAPIPRLRIRFLTRFRCDPSCRKASGERERSSARIKGIAERAQRSFYGFTPLFFSYPGREGLPEGIGEAA